MENGEDGGSGAAAHREGRIHRPCGAAAASAIACGGSDDAVLGYVCERRADPAGSSCSYPTRIGGSGVGEEAGGGGG
ncbi:hypothetical protein OsI_01249 [Oryza sativa Indica Group]|uniref:Uncharacterized protein n=1 Tax=Oryza sativa subsp. indica TaxID=39946 RepID=B8AC90_ORYSI|nr:hypothetical protein OsI_01249 [Oryza sativa Indica Group]